MSTRGWMLALGGVGAAVVTYALWPSAPSAEATQKLMQQYLQMPAESRPANLEHRVMQLRGLAALGAVALLEDPRLRGSAHMFLQQCARAGKIPVPAAFTELEERVKSEKRELALAAGDHMAPPFTDAEWVSVTRAWQGWSAEHKAELIAQEVPCDPRYEL